MKKLILIFGVILFSQISFAQITDIHVDNTTNCPADVWFILYPTVGSDPCNPDCSRPAIDKSVIYSIPANTAVTIAPVTILGSSTLGAWGQFYMQGPAGYNDGDALCGSAAQGNEVCPSFGNMYIQYLSCSYTGGTGQTNVEIRY